VDLNCDQACTKVRHDVCYYEGTSEGDCEPPVKPPAAAANGHGAEPLDASTKLPAWITIEDVNYDAYLRGCPTFAVGEPTCDCEDGVTECVDLGFKSCLSDDMEKLYNGKMCEYMCGPKLTATSIASHPDPYQMLVAPPSGYKFAAVKGHVTSYTRGQMEAFMNVEDFKYDWSNANCYPPSSAKCIAMAASAAVVGTMTENSAGEDGYRCAVDARAEDGSCSPDIESRYVDGISITTRRTSGEAREHVFTLAAGPAQGVPNSDDKDYFKDQKDPSVNPDGLVPYTKCWKTTTGAKAPGCYLGNCACQGGMEVQLEFGAMSGQFDMLKPILGLVALDSVVLIAWGLDSDASLAWRRIVTEFGINDDGDVVEDMGRCDSLVPGAHWKYTGIIIAIHFLTLVFGNVMAFKTRHISTSFAESKYIFAAMASNLQIMFIGIPILYMTAENAGVSYFMKMGIIFLNDLGVMFLIFIPKFQMILFSTEEEIKGQAMSNSTSANTSNNTSSGSVSTSSNGIVSAENKELQDALDVANARIKELEAKIGGGD